MGPINDNIGIQVNLQITKSINKYTGDLKMGAIHLTDINFDQEVLKSNIPVLVDFWASWCGPCRMVGPIVEELSNDYQGKVKITKVDVDANPEKSGQFGIRSIPTMLIFKNGQIIDTLIGAMPKEAIAARLDAARAK